MADHLLSPTWSFADGDGNVFADLVVAGLTGKPDDYFKMAALKKKGDGSPNVRFFESTETVAQLDAVKQWLQKNSKKV